MNATSQDFGVLGYSEEQIALMNVATDFIRARAPVDKARELIDSDSGFDQAIWGEMAALGWLAIAIPEDYDGVGLSLGAVVPIAEQMGRSIMATPFAATTVAAQILAATGTETQKQYWLPKIAGGAIAALALMEAQAGWDLHNIATSATATGNDNNQLVLKGHKQFVTHAACAQLLILSVRFEGQNRLCLIDISALPNGALPDGALRRETIIDETKRSFGLTLDGIIIDKAALLDADHTDAALHEAELAMALLQAAEMCGGTQGVIDYTLDYLRTRKQFGKVIGEYQALKHPMANAYIDYEMARSHLYAAAHSFADQGAGEIAVRMAKAAADNAYRFAADRAIQFHGGFGFTHDCNAGLYRRNAIWCASQYGDAAWHRAKLAALLF